MVFFTDKSWPQGTQVVAFGNSSGDPGDPSDPGEMGEQVRCRPSLPRARIQDDGTSHKLPKITDGDFVVRQQYYPQASAGKKTISFYILLTRSWLSKDFQTK